MTSHSSRAEKGCGSSSSTYPATIFQNVAKRSRSVASVDVNAQDNRVPEGLMVQQIHSADQAAHTRSDMPSSGYQLCCECTADLGERAEEARCCYYSVRYKQTSGGRNGELLRADGDALRALAVTIRGRADEITAVAVATPFSEAASAMPDSATGSAVAAAAAPAEVAYTTVAAKIREMAAAAESSATSYEETEQLFRSQLSRYRDGL